MEKLKLINISALIMQIVGILFLIINGTYVSYHSGYGEYDISFFDRINDYHEGEIFGIIFLGCCIIVTILSIVQICLKKSLKISLLFSIIQIIIFVYFSNNYNTSHDRGIDFTFTPGRFYYFIFCRCYYE